MMVFVIRYSSKKIAGAIRAKRKRLHLSVKQLSEKAGVSYNTIVKIESGANANPTIDTLIRLSTVFDCPIDSFLK